MERRSSVAKSHVESDNVLSHAAHTAPIYRNYKEIYISFFFLTSLPRRPSVAIAHAQAAALVGISDLYKPSYAIGIAAILHI